jgi:hypothetical protein
VRFENEAINHCYFTPQLNYALGFAEEQDLQNGAVAVHAPDMGGGINHLYVYAPNLIENIVVGDETAPLLRVVSITGVQGENREENYNPPMMSRIINTEVNEIDVEIRTGDGRLFPFESGACILTLVFKKALYF